MTNRASCDIHIVKYFSCFISVSEGKVINVTDPILKFCPLAGHLAKELKYSYRYDKDKIKLAVKGVIESKIKNYGFFTAKRKLFNGKTPVAYGASEMLMGALDDGRIDCAVTVCDGAGTVITDKGALVQGIGARMHTLLMTTPIEKTMVRLKKSGCHIVFDNAFIDQEKGVLKAIEKGYKKIAVTVSGHDVDKLKAIRDMEKDKGVKITILVICTTGISTPKIKEIICYADLSWSCASGEVRKMIGGKAMLQISKHIPVFVLTKKGIDFIFPHDDCRRNAHFLKKNVHYLFSNEPGGMKIKIAGKTGFLRKEKLPAPPKENPCKKSRGFIWDG